ncbi:50S ribosomal protein L6 [Gammaproteobacteria bacterium 53_120_T64]|nr:50S ribosomal protein L6 [Gammaproteobacteria bacterium 53_120_T64]
MSRVAKSPVAIPKGVDITLANSEISVKGAGGQLTLAYNSAVEVSQADEVLTFVSKDGSRKGLSHAGTVRALVNNMVTGVTKGFEKRIQLVGVGYRAALQGNKLNLTLGFSHPVVYELPAGVTAEATSQTELLLKSADKQLLGQVASEIRAYRPPEPYKGKGVRYADEHVVRKEAKKK